MKTVALWAVLLGIVGFVSGAIVPFLLDADPGSAQPLFGIFITGPAGVCLGIVLGVIANVARLNSSKKTWVLSGAIVIYASAITYVSVPYYHFVTYLIDGEVTGCKDAQLLVDSRQLYWRDELARVMLGKTDTDRANAGLIQERGSADHWEADVDAVTRKRAGAVLTVHIFRKGAIYEARWTTGRVSRKIEWESLDKTVEIFSETHGALCEQYATWHRGYYQSCNEAWDRYPPRNLPAFLGLDVMKPMESTYAEQLPK